MTIIALSFMFLSLVILYLMCNDIATAKDIADFKKRLDYQSDLIEDLDRKVDK